MSERTDAIADALLAQVVTLARIEAGEQLRVEQTLTPVWRRLRSQIATDAPTAPSTLAGQLRAVQQLVTLATTLTTTVYGAIAEAHDTVRAGIVDWTVQTIQDVLQRIGETVLVAREVSERTLARLAETALVLGASAADWWRRQAATMQRAVGDTLRRDVLQEQPLQAMLTDIAAVTDTATQAATGLVQTSLTSVHQATGAAVMDTNHRQLAGMQWLTTLDNRACLRCIALSGQAWTTDHAPLGQSGRWPGEPPLHWACRCVLIPIPRGETLAQDQPFDAWLRRQPVGEQQAILGPGRFALWQAGRLRLSRLVDQRHRPLTVDELRRESAA